MAKRRFGTSWPMRALETSNGSISRDRTNPESCAESGSDYYFINCLYVKFYEQPVLAGPSPLRPFRTFPAVLQRCSQIVSDPRK
ncbi:hypothetical protein TRIP_B200245 [uncultured Desulfatiglans sp.]|nr:hypothetical protein TRIP_B200245 [uncultured Desulfatiglans sp.]